MPSIKIYPPAQLPDRNVSEIQFNIWKEELEVYLSQEKEFKIFLPGQAYSEWESAEAYNERIRNTPTGASTNPKNFDLNMNLNMNLI